MPGHEKDGRSRRVRRASAAAAIAAVLALTACAGAPEPSPRASSTPDPDATLTIGLVNEPVNLDIRHTSGAAIEQILIDNVYEGLVTRTEDNDVEPRLASDYEISDDGLVYTFTLREGITFHSGAALTSADVVAAYQAVKDDPTIRDHEVFVDTVASIAAPDPATVVITLTQPNQGFLFSLTGRAGLVLSAGDTTDLASEANGTGPYTLDDWKKGSSITFTRNDAYWGDQAGLAEVTFQYIPDFTAGVNAALDGTVDVLAPVGDAQLVPQLEATGEWELHTGVSTEKATLAFNNARKPLDDVRVREALRLAIDHEALVQAYGNGVTQYGPIPELDPGYEDLSELLPHDPDRARALLEEAGQKDLRLTLTIPAYYGTIIPRLLVSDFNEIGVELAVDSVEFPAWLEDVYGNHDYDLSFVLHVEPRDLVNFANPEYYFGYDNPKVQELYDEALRETDPEASEELLAETARLIASDHAADWLFTNTPITAVSPQVAGFPENSINARINLDGVTVTAD